MSGQCGLQRPVEGEPDLYSVDVVVFGGGVTGLTVAHELIERNFCVAVVEPDFPATLPSSFSPDTDNPGLGGVARSQWGVVGNSQGKRDLVQTPLEPVNIVSMPARPPRTRLLVVEYRLATPDLVEFDGLLWEDGEPFAGDGDEAPGAAFLAALVPFVNAMREHTEWQLECRQWDSSEASADLRTVGRALVRSLWEAVPGIDDAEKRRIADRIRINGMSDDPGVERALSVNLNVFTLPGEHGFRFFPSFYRHLFDTMRRIPVTDPESGARRGRDTVYDNLVAVDYAAYVSSVPGPMAILARRAPKSMSEVQTLMSEMQRESGYSEKDMNRLAMKIWKYMTSWRRRRELEYENISWYDYVEGDRFSDRGRFLVQTTPGTLVGLLGSDGDARTQGTILLQCMADQFNNERRSDMLLNGPTDTAWLSHWYRYLAQQGVTFIRGTLDGFDHVPGSDAVRPVVKKDPRGSADDPSNLVRFKANFEGDPTGGKLGERVRHVIALPLLEAQGIAEKFLATWNAHHEDLAGTSPPRDFRSLVAFPQRSNVDLCEEMTKPYPQGPLRHLSGIQYFFNKELRLWQAHTQYLDASAGLTAIAQPQFWLEPRDTVSGYRSVLSVDIGIWAEPDLGPRPPTSGAPTWYPWGKRRQEIALEIWGQLRTAHDGDFPPPWPRMPAPFGYILDRGLVFSSDGDEGTLCDDRTPFLVNETGRFRARPGGSAPTEAPWRASIGYDVAAGGYVLAGTYMHTHTRITSMEAACESGRHAVNALLEHLDLSGEKCQIWDPEDHEPGDFDGAKDLDEELCARGLPHASEIVGGTTADEWSIPSSGWGDVIAALRTSRRR